MPINKKHKLRSKTVNCIFLGYVHHSIAYMFLVVKSDVLDVHINSLIESRDITLFENIFSIKNTNSMSRLSSDVIDDITLESVARSGHDKQTLEPSS